MALRIAAAIALVAVTAPAAEAAPPRPVTGSFSKAEMTVVAVAADGKITRSKPGPRFKLVPPATRFTLHVRDLLGDYRGPIVVAGRKRGTVITGFKAGAKIGVIRLKAGYAVAKVAPAGLDAKRTAKATRAGVPVGAGRLGLVRATSAGPSGAGLDPDRDGLPGAFDVDDDGDLLLDNIDPVASAATHSAGDPFHPIWLINLNLGLTYIAQRDHLAEGVAGFALNRNARNTANDAGAFDRASALTMTARGLLLFPIPQAGSLLSCADLPWCGRARNLRETKMFPSGFSPVDVGGVQYGVMEPVGVFNPINDGVGTTQQLDPAKIFGLKPGVDRTRIAAKQEVFQRLPDGTQRTLLVGTIFGTVPALASWSDGGGGGSAIGYPVPDGNPGTESNGFFVKPSPDGDYHLTMSVWRPQRPPDLAGESDWIDLGQLDYEVVGRTTSFPRQVWRCPERFHDVALDAPVNPASVVTLTVNVSECLRQSGLPAWDLGQPASEVFVAAKSLAGDAAEGVGFAFRAAGTGRPSSAGAFAGVWRYHDGDPAKIDYEIQANQFPTDHFNISLFNNYKVTGGTTPAGFTCNVGTLNAPDSAWKCNGGNFAPGTNITGTLDIAGSGPLSGQLVTQKADQTQGDQGYDLPQAP